VRLDGYVAGSAAEGDEREIEDYLNALRRTRDLGDEPGA
jgi:hypothetical protein